MSIKELDDGRFELDIRTGGRGSKRLRRLFDSREDATVFENYVIHTLRISENGPSSGIDKRRLDEIRKLWWLYHGQTLKNGKIEDIHLRRTILHLENPLVASLDKRKLILHRNLRLSQGISASTINRDMYRLSGMFSALIKLDEYSGENPVRGLAPLAEKNPGMTYLTTTEIRALLSHLKGDYRLVALLSLSTGGRWGEVSSLTIPQILHGRVVFLETKNGKKRVVPISDKLEKEVRAKASSNLFSVDYESFCKKIRNIKPDLPKGQATHVLRHTFASHFMMNGGNIIALQQILGHTSIQQTMAYAHLAPDFLQNAVTLNPLKGRLTV